MTRISIVVPTRNEKDNLERLLKSVKKNSFEDYEIIVVDGGSTDGTRDIARSYGAKVIEGPQEGPSTARDIGWREAKGDIIHFSDADWYLEENALEQMDKFFRENSDVGMGNPNSIKKPSTFVEKIMQAEAESGGKGERIELMEKIKRKIAGVFK